MDQIHILVDENENAPEASQIVASLVAFNRVVASPSNHKPLLISAKDEHGRLLGGLRGYTHWGWLFVAHLWVDEDHKGRGLGSKLMDQAEAIAEERGCEDAWLDTFSF